MSTLLEVAVRCIEWPEMAVWLLMLMTGSVKLWFYRFEFIGDLI